MSKGEYTDIGMYIGPIYIERDEEGDWSVGISAGPIGGIGDIYEAGVYIELSFGKDGISLGAGISAGVWKGFESGLFGAYISQGAYIDSRN